MLHIFDETSALTELCICRGTAVPECDTFRSDHAEFSKFPMLPWDRVKLVEQQDRFHELLDQLGVRLHFVEHSPEHPWQMYTRDTGFVIGNTLFHAPRRELPEREGEIDLVRRSVPEITDNDVIEITTGQIEGGDVLVDQGGAYVGLSTRTSADAVEELSAHVEVTPLYLGPSVMHLDTRMTILPGRHLLIYPGAFRAEDLALLQGRFSLIEVSEAEAQAMGTNVFVINPETVVVHTAHERIAEAIEAVDLRVERVDFSEPNAILGSFRCATMPLARAG